MFKLKFTLNLLVINLILLNCPISSQSYRRQNEEIRKWATTLGYELKRLGETVTKMLEIKEMYDYHQAQVEKKNPAALLKEIVKTVSAMMQSKIKAVERVVQVAEEEAEKFDYNNITTGFPYYSALYSIDNTGSRAVEPTDGLKNMEGYLDTFKPMNLDYDTHFFNLSVNTTYSAVYVPYNIFDRTTGAAYTIQWSEALDKIFTDNYSRDPALFWQYFGAANGILRVYPAKKWEKHVPESFDCRTQTWFIEAATCTKDVVILLDHSGSMEGIRKHIAALTAYSILDTFSNNDFVNILYYNKWTNYTVPCFKGILAQATRENIDTFKKAIDKLPKPENHTYVDQALETALELLHEVRKKRDCLEDISKCNQAIMLITDDVPSNVSEVVMKHNFLNNGTRKPVRFFTYLVGKEVPDLSNILWLTCNNRGYHTNVRALEQITTSVLEYINVIARPLVLSGSHPASWTHAYMDTTVDEKTQDLRLLTSVAMPAFDKKANAINNKTRFANLLGVAGTDVPINDIGRLTFPYKIGVNGYSFIVSNNGYVLKHPNLQPLVKQTRELKINYNSIDLIEVEQFDDNLGPRELNPELVELRKMMVNRASGQKLDINIKYHYDDIKRASRETYDYYYAPIDKTPFTLGLALPKTYGHYSIYVKDVIQKNKPTGTNLTSFFEGQNWKIHPDWVYCKHHYLEGHEHATPEEELLDFLGQMYNKDFVWESQYSKNEKRSETGGDVLHGKDDYYCDKELVQRLVFDADNTKNAFPGRYIFDANEYPIIRKYNVSLRFIATMSGLTRWEYIFLDVENATEKEFGDKHYRAIDETWYKSAVLQHEKSQDAFVFSVPFPPEHPTHDRDYGSITVTASHAIVLSDAGNKAPAAVVGYQFMHSNLKEVFLNIANQHGCDECPSCKENGGLDCYIVDSDGYIIVSSDSSDTGRFFGELEGDVMNSLTEKGFFESITIYDYQAYCEEADDEANSATSVFSSLNILDYFHNWLTWLIFKFSIYNILSNWQLLYVLGQDAPPVMDDDEEFYDEDITPHFFPCDEQSNLYILRQDKLADDTLSIDTGFRNYYVTKIPYTNLILLAINTTREAFDKVPVFNEPCQIQYKNNYTELPCQKKELNDLERSRLQGCINFDEREKEITACGEPSSSQQIPASDHLLYISIFIQIFSIKLIIVTER